MIHLRRWVPYGLALLAGAIGVLLTLVALHLWQDHQLLHTLVTIEAARQAAAQRSAPAGPPPGASGALPTR